MPEEVTNQQVQKSRIWEVDVLSLGCIPRNVLEGDADGTGHSGCRERPLLSGKGPWSPRAPPHPPPLSPQAQHPGNRTVPCRQCPQLVPCEARRLAASPAQTRYGGSGAWRSEPAVPFHHLKAWRLTSGGNGRVPCGQWPLLAEAAGHPRTRAGSEQRLSLVR